MEDQLVAHASIKVNASLEQVWEALINPELIKEYMVGTDVVSEWEEGSEIRWKGEWQGKKYEDKGTILQLNPKHTSQYSHYSPLSGLEDKPENYHTVTIRLLKESDGVLVSLSQDNNTTEEDRQHSEKNWQMMLEGLKGLLDK